VTINTAAPRSQSGWYSFHIIRFVINVNRKAVSSVKLDEAHRGVGEGNWVDCPQGKEEVGLSALLVGRLVEGVVVFLFATQNERIIILC
jgi:hypothetical protein